MGKTRAAQKRHKERKRIGRMLDECDPFFRTLYKLDLNDLNPDNVWRTARMSDIRSFNRSYMGIFRHDVHVNDGENKKLTKEEEV